MASRWFRFYADTHRNPKVAKLSDKDFRLWIELLSVAAERDGFVPCLDDLKHMLKRRLDHLSSAVERLISAGLIERLSDGYRPHNWDKRQYKSDVSTERSRKSRAKCNVAATPPETDTDAETEADITPKAPKGVSKPDDVSDEVWRDWKRVRKKPITATVLKRMEVEAAKLGWTLAQAITEAAESGWQGFKADWVKEKTYGNRNASDGRDGVAKALDRRLGLGQPAGEVGRFDLGGSREDSRVPIARLADLR